MAQRIKLIWDFRGPNAAHIAEHHSIHLDEFVQSENLQNSFSGFEIVSEMYAMAYLVIDKRQMDSLRERLKPNRGQLYLEDQT